MKTVKLTQEEIDVILATLTEKHICEASCYCGYKAPNMCTKTNKNGKPSCKLIRTIESIEQKLLKGAE